MHVPDFEQIVREPVIITERVQDFLDYFENEDWSDIDEGDRELIERARKFKELVTGEGVSDSAFERDCVQVVRENAFAEFVKDDSIELNESAWKAMPRVWQDNIDWDGVADDFRTDYAEIEWEGDTYLFEVRD